MPKIFVAYPSAPPELGQVLERAQEASKDRPRLEVQTWRREDLGGDRIITPIIEAIAGSDVIVGDITSLNFNVTYELGYAVGLGKRVLPTRNRGFEDDIEDIQQIGLFDTLIRKEYATSQEFLDIVAAVEPGRRFATDYPPDPLPLYIIVPSVKDDDCNQLLARAAKAGLRPRTFDPVEQPRLSAIDAVRNVAASHGVAVMLLSRQMVGAKLHNIRSAFVTGIAHALEKPVLILQRGDWPTPLDVRDEVKSFGTPDQFRNTFQEFAEKVYQARYADTLPSAKPTNILASLNLGHPAAENEESLLENFFLERDESRQVLDGRANVVIGRKGAGKTAVYFQVRDRLRSARANVIVDLAPESYQLRRLKDRVLKWLAAGSKESLLAAFWEYVLLLEICGKIIEKDKDVHKRNHELFAPYQQLLKVFRAETDIGSLNFPDRLARLIERLGSQYEEQFGAVSGVDLSDGAVTTLIYKTTLHELREAVIAYTRYKNLVYVLFDNIDKAWNATGLDDSDVFMIRSLLDASRKLGNDFRRSDIQFYCAVFLRNDIYDMLLSATPDRGKETRVLIDWVQRDLLRHLVRRRLLYNFADNSLSIEEAWQRICVPLVQAEDSLNFLIHRSLMRPRFLLALINHCKGIATNFGRNRIDEADIEHGLSMYSSDVVTEVGFEIRDVLPVADGILYQFLGEKRRMKRSEVLELIAAKIPNEQDIQAAFALLLWHGVLGFCRRGDETTFIYDVNYDLRRLRGLMDKVESSDPVVEINSAFWPHLEIAV